MRRRRYMLAAGLALVLSAGQAVGNAADGSELELLDVPDTSVRIALPSEWEVTTGLDYTNFDVSDPAAGYIGLFSAQGVDGSACELRMYDRSRGGLDEHAESVAADRRKSGATTQVTAVELTVGEGRRIDAQHPERGYASEYLWQFDPSTYVLTCSSTDRQPDDWAAVAASLAWQAGSRQAKAAGADRDDLQRVEIPEFDVAVSLPGGLETDLTAVSYEMALPPDGSRTTPVTTVLTAGAPGGIMCGLEVFEGNPLTLEEHAAWVEEVNAAQPGFEGTVTHAPVSLSIGDGVRIDGYDPADGVWTTIYLVDRGDMRYQLYCLDTQRAADDYRSVAETIELLGTSTDTRPAWVPDEAVAWDVAESYTTEVQVSDDETSGFLMAAFCERALWLEYADGTFEERLACELTDDPIEPPELQGTPPTETAFFGGGACEWYSDFWYLTDGREVWAESWSMSVEPDGSVLALAIYGPEMLECAAE